MFVIRYKQYNHKKDFRIYFIIRKIQFLIVKIKNYQKKDNLALSTEKKLNYKHIECVLHKRKDQTTLS